jgi:hypothetical protein
MKTGDLPQIDNEETGFPNNEDSEESYFSIDYIDELYRK